MEKGNIALTTVASAATLVDSFAFKPHTRGFTQLFTDQARLDCNPILCFTTGTSDPGHGCGFSSAIPVYTSEESCTVNTP